MVPAHADSEAPAGTTSPTSRSSAASTPTREDLPAPTASNPEDQDDLDSLWERLLDKLGIIDLNDDSSDEDDVENEDGSDEDEPVAADVAALPAGTNHTTLTAEGFVDSVGVGIHVAYLDTSYGQVDTVALLKDLGVKHVRDGLGSNDSVPIATMKEIGQAGIGINWVSQPEDSSFSIDKQLQLIEEGDLNVESVEGANERDNHGDPSWAGKIREHQAELYEKVKASLGDDVAVVAPSLVHDGSREELGEVPSDVANAHPYTGGHMQTAEQTEHQMQLTHKVTPSVDTTAPQQAEADERVTLKAAVEEGGALYATELGFHTATASTAGNGVQPHVSEDAQATLQLQQLLENYRNGVDRSYVYELLDEGEDDSEAEDHFGLVHSDGSPKPAFTALKNLLSVMKGSISTSSSATTRSTSSSGAAGARALGVQVEGGGEATTSVVLPRADGSSVVALWEAEPVWDPDAARALDVPTREVTLRLDGTADAQVYVPRKSAKAGEAQEGTDAVSVSSQADPTIIVLTPADGTPSTSGDADGADAEEPSAS
ncbi:hypothetical protein [Kineococcus indalonis]|uniref:hypothetical protein n=1 Tax=Kineococcus indalonis TaxID=2696566 RepID=UPI0014126609|nr:hypothetical protein [Kineococcus indalonis]NAZ84568.1 hypothetical protein [Kineococcus indalonis]